MEANKMTLVVLPQEVWSEVIKEQQKILQQLLELKSKEAKSVPPTYLTAKVFMEAINIKRTKFDELVKTNKIKIIKKRRKIYVAKSEVDRYFNDPNIQ